MKKRFNSINATFYFSFIIIMITIICFIYFIILCNWQASLDSIISRTENEANKDIQEHMNTLINIPMSVNESTCQLLKNGIIDFHDPKSRATFLGEAVSSSDDEICSFCYGLENGEYYGAGRNQDDALELYACNADTGYHTFSYAANSDLTEGAFLQDYGGYDPRARSWYSEAKKTGKPVFSSLYKLAAKEEMVLTAAYPIYDKNGALQGVLGTHMTLTKLSDALKEIMQDKGTACILEKDTGLLVANSEENPNFSVVNGELKRIGLNDGNNEAFALAYGQYLQTQQDNFIVKAASDKLRINIFEYDKAGLDWLVITALPEKLFTSNSIENIQITIVLTALSLLVTFLIYKRKTDSILNPIKHFVGVTEKFSKGDLKQRVTVYKNDEIGILGNAFNRMADEICMLVNNLEEKVIERTVDLQFANTELEKAKTKAENANHAKSEFLANMSHEIRTPLNAILGFCEILGDSELAPQNKRYVETIRKAGNNLLTLINDLLDLSKIEQGKIGLQYKPTNLVHILHEVEDIFKPKVEHKKIRLLLDIQKEFPVSIYFDEARIRQVLLNVVGNAIKFTDKGYVKVSLSYTPAKDADCINLKIVIEDTGIGIPEQERENIFKPFEQASGDINKKYGGTGLGLSITQKFIELMHGSITLQSNIGRGSAFTIEIGQVRKADSRVIFSDTAILTKNKEILEDSVENTVKIIYNTDIFNNLQLTPDVLLQFRQELYEDLKRLNLSIILGDVGALADRLTDFGIQNTIHAFVVVGKDLSNCVSNCDILKIKIIIQKLLNLLENN